MTFDPTRELDAATVADLAARLGIGADEVTARLAGPAAPLVADHIADYLAECTENTRRTYATPLRRLRDGVGPICDQHCEPCLSGDFTCRCDCAPCRSSRVVVPALAAERVSALSYSEDHARTLTVVARRMAVKKGIVDNRRRAERGLVPKMADGYGAEETTVAALRSLFQHAVRYTNGVNHAQAVKKPRRADRERRPLQDFELIELHMVTSTGGNDPELDTLMLDYGIATGARREGVYTLTVGQLHRDRQVIDLRDKYKRRQPAPVSTDLLDRLFSHAIERGGDQCDPAGSAYRPDAPVFWFRAGGTFRPITERRIDTLCARWQKTLPWAAQEQLGFHHIRHTISAIIAIEYGPQYKKRYRRHADGSVTDRYGACTFEELARAMSDLLDFEHPLVHGIDERRTETLGRLGFCDDGV
jgi:site-specific recombinase XerD